MPPMRSDAKREHRIEMEIIVDANGPEEEAMGWYCYLEHTLCFPFTATCIADRAISPVYKGDEVDILGMAPERECEHEMFVETHWGRCNLAIPLAQVKPMRSTNVATRQAVADWHYWVGSGRTF